MKRLLLTSLTLCYCTLFFGCSSTKQNNPAISPLPGKPTLRVGVAPVYAPMAFKKNNQLKGFEIEAAQLLAKEMGNKMQFVELNWDELIPALLGDRIDLIMSGFTITKARRVRIAFTEPYHVVSQAALIRVNDQDRLNSRKDIMEHDIRIGVQRGTTGEQFVELYCPQATKKVFSSVADAAWALGQKSVDAVIFDNDAILWEASKNEADFTVVADEKFTVEELGWGLRRTDAQLKKEVNEVLARWKTDGTLKMLLSRWIPENL